MIAHRQNVPASAQLISQMAGMAPRWQSTQQTSDGLLGSAHSGRGTRRRAYEPLIQPSAVSALRTGEAVVITPGAGPPVLAQIHAPGRAHAQAHAFLQPLRRHLERLRKLKPKPRRNP